MNGNPDQDVEEVIAYELGYRLHAGGKFSLDIATFYNVYDQLQSYRRLMPTIRSNFGNDLRAHGYGGRGLGLLATRGLVASATELHLCARVLENR